MSTSSSSEEAEYKGDYKLNQSRHSHRTSNERAERHRIVLNRDQYRKVMRFLSKDTPPPRDNIIVSLTWQEINYIQLILESDDS